MQFLQGSGSVADQPDESAWRSIPLNSRVTRVQPMTGIVLWATNPGVETDSIQLEYSYLRYADIVTARQTYDWATVDRLLAKIAGRGHQAVLRFYFEYPGKPSAEPAYLREVADYLPTEGTSEGKPTTFADWSHPELHQATLDFYSALAARYDHDPRIAFLQTGFGLWAEYHIYDGPMKLGKTFPSKEFQARFVRHLSETFRLTPWSVSIDAADRSRSPLAEEPSLRELTFGLFDDSFMCQTHSGYNRDCWLKFGSDRWHRAPAGGEFSYYTDHDQRLALGPKGPHGIAFEQLASDFHLSYVIGDGQPRYQPTERIVEAGLALGYRFRVTRFRAQPGFSEVTVLNEGIAPLYHDAYVTVDGVRGPSSLKGLLPGESLTVRIAAGGLQPELTIESDRLVPGQEIGYNASL
ncbi:MAG: DUF4832 domain-containing protein [Planctomycetaceae bacterium]|nr:MAG: DUF4832 domain-containing protein [Planctomycetaceae bacterium]